jgi:ABC-type tungstate transport system permease subunit
VYVNLPKPFLAPTKGDRSLPICTGQSISPYAVYDGGFPDAQRRGICIRIANGGAGQAGLVKAWADAFVKDRVARGSQPFQIAWYLGDTTDSLAMLASGVVDFALTYNAAAETQSVKSGAASKRVYAFRDHFILAGPIHNPAQLEEDDDILTMFNKIVVSGNRDAFVPPEPDVRPATRFLSRFDKSATNIKESQLFVTIGQVPWALGYSKWYHQYPRFPQEALRAASLLSEYTLTDRGTWLTAPKSITSRLRIYKMGSDDADDLLLNPAHLLYGSRNSTTHAETCRAFLDWVVSPAGGQGVIEAFSKQGQAVYTKAP